jgi:hypothetical protein
MPQSTANNAIGGRTEEQEGKRKEKKGAWGTRGSEEEPLGKRLVGGEVVQRDAELAHEIGAADHVPVL